MYRFLGFLLLAVFAASLNFAQVAPIAKPRPTVTPAVSDDEEDDDEDTPAPNTAQPSRPLVAQAPKNSPAPVAPRPAPSIPRVVATPAKQPAAPNRAPVTQPAPQQGGQQMVRLQFPNSDVTDVLHLYEQLTGKKLVMDNFVQGKVSIFIAKDVPRDEAIKIIEMNLLLNGYSLVPSQDPDIVKVIGTGKNPRTTGVPIISDEDEIPDGDHVISYLFKLRYADPTELQQALGQYLSPPQPYTSFLALPKAGAILVTENSSVIRTLARIIDQIDVRPAEVVSEFIKVERATASDIADKLNDLAGKPAQGGTGTKPGGVRGVRTGGAPNVPQPAVAEGGAELPGLSGLSEEAFFVGKPTFTADVRTNRIHVVSRPINMPIIRKIIEDLDADVEFAKPVVRALNYISAADVLPVIVQALTEPGQAGAGGAEGPAQPAVPGASATPSRRTTSYAGTSTGTTTTSTTGSTTAGTGGGTLNVSEELSTQPVDTRPTSVTVGNAKLIADQRANSIIILGSQEVVTKVQKILDEMDVKAPQVALSTVIGELTLSDDEEFGVDYFVRANKRVSGTTNFTGIPPFTGGTIGTSGTVVSGTGNIFDPGNIINFTQLAAKAASGANVYLAAGNTLASVVHVLESTGKFHVINRPIVFTSNNKKAIIASGTEIPVPVNTLTNVVNQTNVNGTAAVASNIEFKRVALQLEVVPLINSAREVQLDILQKLDSLAGSTIVNGNSIPNIATRYVRTNVTAPNASTIVLGGLITESKDRNTKGFPVLSHIPYIGALFRNTTNNKTRNELIVLMCPEVTMTNLEMQKLREKVEDHTHFGPELDQGYCPDCPPTKAIEEKQLNGKQLPPPDLPFGNQPTKKTK